MSIGQTTAIVGIDVGATTIAGGLVASDGEVLWATRTPTHEAGPGTAVEALLSVVDTTISEARRERFSVAAIGVGLPGVVDVDCGMMISDITYLMELSQVPLAERIRSVTGLPTFVENDVNALALGEWRFGIGRGVASMALLAIGTGIGGALILNGALVRGQCGYAGELGHIPINFDGPECLCGGRGCLEIYIGGRKLAEEARRRADRGGSSGLLARAGGNPDRITTAFVFEAAADGDPLATELVDRACEALGALVGSIVNSVNPELIVVTGGVAKSIAPLEKDVARRAARYAFGRPFEATRFCVVPGDKRLTVRGGAALALYELDRQPERRDR